MHATAIVTGAVVTRSGPATALPATEGFRDGHRSDMVDPRIGYADPPVPRAFGICRQTFADRNVDRQVESTRVDILARHLKDANLATARPRFDLPPPIRDLPAGSDGAARREDLPAFIRRHDDG